MAGLLELFVAFFTAAFGLFTGIGTWFNWFGPPPAVQRSMGGELLRHCHECQNCTDWLIDGQYKIDQNNKCQRTTTTHGCLVMPPAAENRIGKLAQHSVQVTKMVDLSAKLKTRLFSAKWLDCYLKGTEVIVRCAKIKSNLTVQRF